MTTQAERAAWRSEAQTCYEQLGFIRQQMIKSGWRIRVRDEGKAPRYLFWCPVCGEPDIDILRGYTRQGYPGHRPDCSICAASPPAKEPPKLRIA